MKAILQIGDVAGIPQTISYSLRKLGYKSEVLSYTDHQYQYGADYKYPIVNQKFPFNSIEKMRTFLKYYDKYEIFHFHGGSLLPKGIDTILWKLFKKNVIIHHHGSELRRWGEKIIYPIFADSIIVATPDLLKWSPNAEWIPNPIPIENYPYVKKKKQNSKKITIVHAPSNRAIKGTSDIIRAVKQLKGEGYNIELKLVENTPHKQAVEIYKCADIAIDQLNIGWYGRFAIECMCLGKPVCAYIREDLESYMPFNPLINISKENIVERLKNVIEDEKYRQEVGEISRKYVEQEHDSNKIALKLLSIYDR